MKMFSKINIYILSLFTLFFSVCLNYAQNNNEVEYNENLNIYRIVALRNQNQQIVSVSNAVSVEKPYALYAPSAFSPDGDGINDFFSISGQSLSDFQIEVYNRWGQMVYKSKNISDNWNGKYNGKDLPPGTYVYKIKTISLLTNEKYVKSGTVSLVR
ncbi:MAG: gliding motility-associated C-terminal domain-containing protein [Flavobacteriales bacterium]|nr:gliding motility-associated C-terminal domain-containing protein [Flavobacteriales bacterium]|tara:strand:+ start:856 stop:1326 length:471 start_codon:yes stop_codon:yes gene_type:complete